MPVNIRKDCYSMAESKKGATSSVNPKEKTSGLDLDIGKDFLTSWKSMSVMDDDGMDFDFGTAAKGKKKSFIFDKSEMDFNFDGDFGKLSSFKIDMSDLDISSPTKKAGKPKEKSKDGPAGENKNGKPDRMTFSFDFNDLDSFSFEPSLAKSDKKSNKIQDKEESSSKSEASGRKEDSMTQKVQASEGQISSKTDTHTDGAEVSDSKNGTSPSKSVINDTATSKYVANDGSKVPLLQARTSPEKTCTLEKDQDSDQPEKRASPDQDSTQSLPINASSEETAPELLEERSAEVVAQVSASSNEEQNDNVKLITDSGSSYGNSSPENNLPEDVEQSNGEINNLSSPENNLPEDVAQSNGEINNFGADHHVQTANEGDLYSKGTSIIGASRESPQDIKADGDNQDSTLKLPTEPLRSVTTVEKLMPIKAGTGVMRSKFFMRSEETKSQLQILPLTHQKLSSSSSKGSGSVQLTLADQRGEHNSTNAQSGSKSTFTSLPNLRVLTGNLKSGKNFSSIGEGYNVDATQTGSKLNGASVQYDRDVTKGQSDMKGSENNGEQLRAFSSQVIPSNVSEQTNKSTLQKSLTTRSVVGMSPLQNMRNSSVERDKISASRAGNPLDWSTLNISRSLEQNKKPQENTAPKLVREMKTSPMASLKRKTFEASSEDNVTLNPSKRLSESPVQIRSLTAPPERVADKQVDNHESLEEGRSDSVLNEHYASALDISWDGKMREPQSPFAMETDSNIEKAEACAKKLEDICSMLKKKHEEANELLVRAIVNNNNLLMLNHPIYLEKISTVQKFAAALTSKELRT